MTVSQLARLADLIQLLGADLTAQAIHQASESGTVRILRTLEIYAQYEPDSWHDWSKLCPITTPTTEERAA